MLDIVLIITTTAVGAFFRFWNISTVPPGLSSDEADWGYITLRILDGYVFQISELGTLFSYLAALPTLIMGQSATALRVGAALGGILTIPLIYLWVYEAFKQRFMAFAASWLYAVTFACVHVNRLAFPPNPLPLVQTFTWYMLWRGLNRKEKWAFAWGGITLGLSLYCYQASFALIFAAIIFWIVWVWKNYRKGAFKEAALFWTGFWISSLPFLMTFLPVIDQYIRSPHYVNQFIFNPQVHQGELIPLLARQISEHVALFGLTGDRIWRHNLPGRPFFGFIIAAFFWAGVVIAILRVCLNSYFFALLNFGIMLLPGVLARTDTGPHFLHLAGAFVPACLFPAVAMSYALDTLSRKKRVISIFVGGFFFLLLGIEGFRTFHDYFKVWAVKVGETMSFEEIFVRTAHLIKDCSPQPEIWVLPNSATEIAPFTPSSFSFSYTGDTPFQFVPANESEAPKILKELSEKYKLVGLVEWDFNALKWAAPIHYDKKGLLKFLLERAGNLKEQKVFNGISISLYKVSTGADFDLYPLDSTFIIFGDVLVLKGYKVGGTGSEELVRPGRAFWVVFEWEAVRPPERDYKVALYVTDEAGHLITQDDRMLFDRIGLPTGSWQAGHQGLDYRLILIPPGTPPGNYWLNVAVYEPETLQKLPVTEGPRASARIAKAGIFTVTQSYIHNLPQPGVEVNANLGKPPSLRWLGFEPPPQELIPGDKFTLIFYWQALKNSPAPGKVKVELVDFTGKTVQSVKFPIGLNYPAYLWEKGEAIADRYDVELDRKVPSGAYALNVSIELEGQEVKRELGTIKVKGWERVFEMPAVKHEVDVYFEGFFRLVGYEFSPIKPGENLSVTLCWQALVEMSVSYVTFIHLLNPEGYLVSQMDTIPGYGKYPTTSWMPGEYICAVYELPIPAEGSKGNYVLSVGAYDPITEERLILRDRLGSILGTSFKIAEFELFP